MLNQSSISQAIQRFLRLSPPVPFEQVITWVRDAPEPLAISRSPWWHWWKT